MAFRHCFTSNDFQEVLDRLHNEMEQGTTALMAEQIRYRAIEGIRELYCQDEETIRNLIHCFMEVSIRHPLFHRWVAEAGIHIQRLSREQSWDQLAYWLSHGATTLRPPTEEELLSIARNMRNMTASQGRCYDSAVYDNTIIRQACRLYEERSGMRLIV